MDERKKNFFQLLGSLFNPTRAPTVKRSCPKVNTDNDKQLKKKKVLYMVFDLEK